MLSSAQMLFQFSKEVRPGRVNLSKFCWMVWVIFSHNRRNIPGLSHWSKKTYLWYCHKFHWLQYPEDLLWLKKKKSRRQLRNSFQYKVLTLWFQKMEHKMQDDTILVGCILFSRFETRTWKPCTIQEKVNQMIQGVFWGCLISKWRVNNYWYSRC